MQDPYRPTTWDEVVGQPTDAIRKQIDGRFTPNFLLHGPPGTGKTTTAKIIAEAVGGLMEVNASDDRGIEYVRDEIVPKAKQTTLSGEIRVVLLDEMEGMTLDAQQALRQPMEQSPSVFVLCTNDHDPGAGEGRPDLDAVHDALISRAACYEFGPVADRAIRERIEQVAEQDGIDLADEQMETIMGFSHDGDVRSAIQRYKQVTRGAIEGQPNRGGSAPRDGNTYESASRGFLGEES